ncbi:MAG: hypothetical protein EP330_28675 [Deltaproteobacteria bacterium]|nr:MAG: hypothetical protein EP330_28675 [Deltaproteobacteria bacterium]
MHTRFALGLVALALPVLAHAQDPDEFKTPVLIEDAEESAPLTADIAVGTEWHESNNMDFRPLDIASDQAILDSDDRSSFAFTSIDSNIRFQAHEQVLFAIDVSHRGMWGGDQLGMTNAFGGMIFVRQLNAQVKFGPGDDALAVTMGRQFFRMGGLPTDEFIISDNIDGIRVDKPISGFGTITAFPIEVPSQAGADDDIVFAQFVSQFPGSPFNFRGESMTRRHGLLLTVDDAVEGLDARAYAWYTDIGAMGSGADISYDGNLGNFADNDWVANFGVRAAYSVGPVTPFVSFDASTGIDRKELVAIDAKTDGIAILGGLSVDTRDRSEADQNGLVAVADYFMAFGPTYAGNGLMENHGYVGMKAQHIGGHLTSRFMGWHPTAYIGSWGLSEDLHEPDRKGGTQVIHAEAAYHLPGPLSFNAGFWNMKDTGLTGLDFANVDTMDPPFGYSRDEFKAQERLGKSLGSEINLGIQYSRIMENANTPDPLHVDFGLVGAMFLPGEYYAIPISRIAGDQLGGEEMGWALSARSKVWF